MLKIEDDMIEIKFQGLPYLGQTLNIDFTIKNKKKLSELNLSISQIREKMIIDTEWIIIDPSTKKILSTKNGNSLYLDENMFLKQIKVYSTPKIENLKYFGMPYQKEFKVIDLELDRLKNKIEKDLIDLDKKLQGGLDLEKNSGLNGGKVFGNSFEDNEVDKIYSYFSKNIIEYNDNVKNEYNFIFGLENVKLNYYLYQQNSKVEGYNKKLKTLEEEKNYWKNNFERQKKELQKITDNLQITEKKNKEFEEKIIFLLEEKNYFINSKFFKNTNDLSFLDEKSQELNQSKLINFENSNLQPIPFNNYSQTNIFEMTLIEEGNTKKSFLKEKKNLLEKIETYENLLKNYKKEITFYKQIYSQNKIDFVINENKKLKSQIKSLNNQLEGYKAKLLKFDFAYKYISKEFENLKSYKIGNNLPPDENFVMASKVIQNLTQDIYRKNEKIKELGEKIKKLKSEFDHNQTF